MSSIANETLRAWPRPSLFGIHIDGLGFSEAVDWVISTAKRHERPCRFVVTPNADHAILLQEDAGLRAAYGAASLVLPDGWPVVAASRLLGRPLATRIAGSDLAPSVFEAASPRDPLTVFLLGAMPGVAARAGRTAELRYPGVRVVGAYGPPLGFERDEAENGRIIDMIRTAKPELLVLGMGTPKQELWVHRHRDQVEASVALCIGATIDFMAGEQVRAPKIMRRLGLEWFYRAMRQPRRLVPRYARNAVEFPKLVLREWLNGRAGGGY